MVDRRRFLHVAAGAGAALAPGQTLATTPRDLLQYLCPPGNLPDQLSWEPSPHAEPFKAELFIPPVLEPQPLDALEPPADPRAHQLWGTTLYGAWDLMPRDSHTVRQREFRWPYHPDPPYDQGTVSWGWAGPDGWSLGERLADDSAVTSMTPGPVIHARYGRSVVVRQINELPPVGASQATFALPSTTIHLHNGHTASESDGNPQDWIDSGEFWDHHYGNFPSGGRRPRETDDALVPRPPARLHRRQRLRWALGFLLPVRRARHRRRERPEPRGLAPAQRPV